MQRRLHIGGRASRDGWEILNIQAGPAVDHVGDAVELGRFESGCFGEIYASHVLEHFDYRQTLAQALAEWYRVLKPGGVLRLSVPDLDILAHLLLQRHKLSVAQRFEVMRMIFGGQVDEYDHHKVGLNQEFLTQFLTGAGFEGIQRVRQHGLFVDTSTAFFAGVPISINLIASKPAPALAS